MTWTARLALSFLAVICTQSLFAQGQNTPWSSTELADAFINAFMNEAGRTGAFTADQLDDMSTIGDTIKTAMDKMARSNKSSKGKLQALNMAFASSMAEIAAVEQGGLSVDAKTNAIADSLNSAFYQTTGAANPQFVNEIRSLITMFAQSSANEVSYGGGYGGQSAGAAASAAAAGGGGQGGYGNLGGQGAGAAAAAAASAAEQGGYGGLGSQGAGRGGYGGQGAGAAAAAAAAGGAGQGGQGLGGQGAAAAAGGAGQGGYGGLGGQGAGRGAGAAAAAAGGAGQGGYGGLGSEVRNMMEMYDVNIIIPPQNEHSDIITIKGPPENVAKTKEALKERIEQLELEKQDRLLRSFQLTVEVDPQYHPKIIGRSGAVITKIRRDHNVQINFPEREGANERVITITGYEKDAEAAKEAILKLVQEQEDMYKEDVSIDSRIHSRIIGSRGRNVVKIMEQFKVDIRFPRSSDPDPDIVVIQGAEDDVLDAKDHLLNLEEEYLLDLREKDLMRQYTMPPSRNGTHDSEANRNDKGFVVKGAPWDKKGAAPDTTNTQEFPSFGSGGDMPPKPVAWGPSRR